jgi:hypothetical protein
MADLEEHPLGQASSQYDFRQLNASSLLEQAIGEIGS